MNNETPRGENLVRPEDRIPNDARADQSWPTPAAADPSRTSEMAAADPSRPTGPAPTGWNPAPGTTSQGWDQPTGAPVAPRPDAGWTGRPESPSTGPASPFGSSAGYGQTSGYGPTNHESPLLSDAPHHPGGTLTTPAHQPGGTPTTTRPRRGGLRTVLVASLVAAVVGAGAGIGGYALLGPEVSTTASQVQVAGGNAPVSAVTDGTVAEAAAVISPSTVTIDVASPQGQGLGTGIVIDAEGHVLTNQHVVEGAGSGGRIQVTLDDGRTVGATVVGESTTTDLAVIRLDGADVDLAGLTPVTFATSDSVEVGQSVVAVGAPLGLSKTVTSGVVSNVARPVRSGLSGEAVYQAVQTDAAINPGNSGGPLVDLDGRVVGINSSIASTTDTASGQQAGNIGIGFAIPADVASRIAGDIVATGTAPEASLGVSLVNPAADGAGSTRTDVAGAPVAEVSPGSAAAQAGLQAGDVVTAVGQTPTPDADALIAAIRYQAPGAVVTVQWTRDGSQEQSEVTLGTA